MAQYNIYTDKIEGCEPGTLAYMHEEGHRLQFRNKWIRSAHESLGTLFLYVAPSFAVLPYLFDTPTEEAYFFYGCALSVLVATFFYSMVLELHAWIYALVNYKR